MIRYSPFLTLFLLLSCSQNDVDIVDESNDDINLLISESFTAINSRLDLLEENLSSLENELKSLSVSNNYIDTTSSYFKDNYELVDIQNLSVTEDGVRSSESFQQESIDSFSVSNAKEMKRLLLDMKTANDLEVEDDEDIE
tara:strand:- start:2785 stop:3207 length:423 start_codon:yes stop_codon:yes gene_type:complete